MLRFFKASERYSNTKSTVISTICTAAFYQSPKGKMKDLQRPLVLRDGCEIKA